MHACIYVHIVFSISDLYNSAEGVILKTKLVATTQEMHHDRDHGFEERFKVNTTRIIRRSITPFRALKIN